MLIQVLNGLVYGGLLYIISVGLVLIFGLRRVVNFAHGSLFMLGSYIAYTVNGLYGPWAAVAAAIAAMAVVGALLDLAVFKPLQHEDPIVTVLVTFGLLLVLEDLARTVWGKDFLSLRPPPVLDGTVLIAGSEFPVYRLVVIGVAMAVAVGLSLWLRWSRVGLYVRASSVDRLTTAMQGVDTNRVSAMVVALGGAFAGLSGSVAAPLIGLSPGNGSYILIESFIVVVVGGLGSFSGALIAALLIGEVQNFGIAFFPAVAAFIPFVLMVAVLIWRPTGFAGSRI